jgi:hypothetical protein
MGFRVNHAVAHHAHVFHGAHAFRAFAPRHSTHIFHVTRTRVLWATARHGPPVQRHLDGATVRPSLSARTREAITKARHGDTQAGSAHHHRARPQRLGAMPATDHRGASHSALNAPRRSLTGRLQASLDTFGRAAASESVTATHTTGGRASTAAPAGAPRRPPPSQSRLRRRPHPPPGRRRGRRRRRRRGRGRGGGRWRRRCRRGRRRGPAAGPWRWPAARTCRAGGRGMGRSGAGHHGRIVL